MKSVVAFAVWLVALVGTAYPVFAEAGAMAPSSPAAAGHVGHTAFSVKEYWRNGSQVAPGSARLGVLGARGGLSLAIGAFTVFQELAARRRGI